MSSNLDIYIYIYICSDWNIEVKFKPILIAMKKLLVAILLALCFMPGYSQRKIFGLTLGTEIRPSEAESILQRNGISAIKDDVNEVNIDYTLKSHDVEFGGYSWKTILFQFKDGFFIQARFVSPEYQPQRYKTIREVLMKKYPKAFIANDEDDNAEGYRMFTLYLDEYSTTIELFANILGKPFLGSKYRSILLTYMFHGELQIDSSHYNDF